jgi:hypothetical protein
MTSGGSNENLLSDEIIQMASEPTSPPEFELRDSDRHSYKGYLVLILLDRSGNPGEPIFLQAENISTGGIGVVSRYMFHVGSIGAAQLLRSDGKTAIVGVEVKHCRYVGDMRHSSGFQFTAVPPRIKQSHFMTENGRRSLIQAMMPARNST